MEPSLLSGALLSPLQTYCRAQSEDEPLYYCAATGSCHTPRQRCSIPAYDEGAAPDLSACLRGAQERCGYYGSPLEQQACTHGVLYAQSPRLLVTASALSDMALFPRAFLTGMERGLRCDIGVVPTL
jgi:hypothetical protein